jgi:thioredoxin 1
MPTLTNAQELECVLYEAGKSRMVILKFGAPWCVSCNDIAKEYAELLKRFSTVIGCEVDFDTSRELFDDHGVSAMPSFVIFRDGKPIEMLRKPNVETIAKALLYADELQRCDSPPELVLDAEF